MSDERPLKPVEVLIAEALPSDGDCALAPLPPKPKILSPQQIRRLGALQVEEINDKTLDTFLEAQEQVYLSASREELIMTLLDRDRHLALEGRALVEGKVGARLLREFVRGVLAAADRHDMSVQDRFEQILQALGAEPADRRQLAKWGTTLGPAEGEAQQRAEDLASGKLKE